MGYITEQVNISSLKVTLEAGKMGKCEDLSEGPNCDPEQLSDFLNLKTNKLLWGVPGLQGSGGQYLSKWSKEGTATG